ncbi:MAG: hypothetical protein SP1CHLAM54_14480 [Chlamydiia bacterium]|nr:hypothetical protein [Chlamydiia bacterium]MCH9616339.1 hypothetical protein [Chlamydiia bacterium]MCH9629675.1 hypothetical protein [Chlamydiia bacterium]
MHKISYRFFTFLIAVGLVAGVIFKITTPQKTKVTFVDATVENLYRIIHSYDDQELIEVEGYPRRFKAKMLKQTPIQQLLEKGHFVSMPKFFAKLGQTPITRINPRETSADIVVFSYDRPMQLYAFLESTERYVKNAQRKWVIYRTSDDVYEKGYETVKKDFPAVRFLRQESRSDFKTLVKKAMQADYIAFAVDDLIIKDHINLKEAALEMQTTGAYGFYYRLGTNITHCYMQERDVALPHTINLGSGLYAWQFSAGDGDWNYPNSVDFTLFCRSDIEKELLKLKFDNPSGLEEKWSKKANLERVGLCTKYSKVVNIPLNVVSQKSRDFGNRTGEEYTTKELLEIFNQGYKIDVEKFFQVRNTSPHAELDVHFIERNGA